MNTVNNVALERLMAEQGHSRLHYYRALIQSGAWYRNLELYASSKEYARRMAEAQITPADRIVSINVY